MALQYDPADWYWQISDDIGRVFSSSRMRYVPVTDDVYERFLITGGKLITISDAEGLSSVIQTQSLPLFLQRGLQITSTGNSSLNGTYSLDATTLNQIGSVARDAASGMGLPEDAATFTYPDINGIPHSFNDASIISIYKAMRNYVSAVNTAVSLIVFGQVVPMPSNSVTIP